MPSSVAEVRSAPIIILIFALLGGVNVVLGLLQMAQDAFGLNIIAGLILLIAAVVHMRRPYFRLERDVAGGRSILSGPGWMGALARGVVAHPGERFAIERGRLVHVAADGTRTLTTVWRSAAHPGDWRALEAALSVASPQQPSDAPENDAS